MKVLLLGGYNYKMPINTYTIPEGSHVHTTQVDFVSRPTQSIVHLVQYDTTLQIIEVALYSDRNKFIIPADADVFMRWSNKDRTFVYPKTLGCNKSRTSIYVEVSDKMTKTYGPSNPIIEISLNGKVAGSQSIPVYVERNPVQSGDVESSDGYKDYMDGILSQIQNTISSESLQIERLNPSDITFLDPKATLSNIYAYHVGTDENDGYIVSVLLTNVDTGGYLMYKGKKICRDIYSADSTSSNGRYTILFGCLVNS